MSVMGLSILLIGLLVVFLISGLPIVFILGGLAVIGNLILEGPGILSAMIYQTFGLMWLFPLMALPLFIFMGSVIEKSGMAERLYDAGHRWMGPLRGGLGIGTVLICALFAAMTGISGAATVTMGLIALPAMLSRKYGKEIAIGCIAAGGALGILIPPSVSFILIGLMGQVSIGRLFAAGLFPGLLLAALFCVYIGVRCFFQPRLGPALPPEERGSWKEKFDSLRGIILPVGLVIMVLGSIFGGITSITEAAAMGAFGSLICAAVYRRLNWETLKYACFTTLRITSMVMWILFAARAFTSIFVSMGLTDTIGEALMAMPGGQWGALIAMQVFLFLWGCVLDPTSMTLINVPLMMPIIKSMGFSPVWFSALFVININIGFLTPPFGYNLFYLKGIAPKGVTMQDIYRSVIFFVILQIIGLAIVMIFPQIALWLPNLIFGIET